MYPVLLAFIAIDSLLIALAVTLGSTLTTALEVNRHYLLGLLVSTLTCFIHCLVLFYLIGTGSDVRRQKVRAFPAACFAIVFMVLAVLMGGEVHSRLIAAAAGADLPLRGVPFWWVHLVLVAAAVLSSAHAFRVELEVVKENRRGILALNEELQRRQASAPSASPPD
jgi:amino acid transporter